MIKKIIIFIFFLNYLNSAVASINDKIISNLIKTKNLTFKFEQLINEKKEEGICTIKYQKKIYCLYNNVNKKILVSDGKSLVIKNHFSNQYYRYPLRKTPLNLILDKNYIINKIKNLDARIVDNKLINFTLLENENKINIFFDNKNYNLVGWQTEDIYQNLVITFISDIKINEKIDKRIFILPTQD